MTTQTHPVTPPGFAPGMAPPKPVGEMTDADIAKYNEAAIGSLQASPADEPGTLPRDQIIHRGDADLPVPMVASAMESAGYTYIWDTQSFERSITNNNMLPTQLRKRRTDGSLVFMVYDPGVAPRHGTLRCMLHAQSPNRGDYDALGLPVCAKSNMSSPHDVERHMRAKHRMEWDTLQRERERGREDRTEQREEAFIDIAKQMLAQNAASRPVEAETQVVEVPPSPVDAPSEEAPTFVHNRVCAVCGDHFGHDTNPGVPASQLSKHLKAEHPDVEYEPAGAKGS